MSGTSTAALEVLRYADVLVDRPQRTVTRGDTALQLSDREFDLLVCFMRHPEEVLDKDRILREVWGARAEENAGILPVYANYLRNKLEARRFPRLIHTVRGVGYVLSREEPRI